MWISVIACLGVLAVGVGGQPPPVPPLGGEFDDKGSDGSYKFGFQTGDRGNHYRTEIASKENQVAGRFGARDPLKNRVVETQYTAGRRGFRAKGPNIARQMDLSQNKIPYNPPVRQDSPNYNPTYKGYHDPNEDPTYKFGFRTPHYSKQETSDSNGHVEGVYSFVDDIGERHDVRYKAGSVTGFHVETAFPDSKLYNGLFHTGPPGKPGGKPRGRSAIQQKVDGSYQFIASAPDHRRTETSDNRGNVRGSYTFLDDKGQQRTIEYIAGPKIGYKVIKKEISRSFPAAPSFAPATSFFSPFSPNFEGVDSGDFPPGGGSGRPKPSVTPGGSSDLFVPGPPGNSFVGSPSTPETTFGGGGSPGSAFGGSSPPGSSFGGSGPPGSSFGGSGSPGSTFGGSGPPGSTFGGSGSPGSTFGGSGPPGSSYGGNGPPGSSFGGGGSGPPGSSFGGGGSGPPGSSFGGGGSGPPGSSFGGSGPFGGSTTNRPFVSSTTVGPYVVESGSSSRPPGPPSSGGTFEKPGGSPPYPPSIDSNQDNDYGGLSGSGSTSPSTIPDSTGFGNNNDPFSNGSPIPPFDPFSPPSTTFRPPTTSNRYPGQSSDIFPPDEGKPPGSSGASLTPGDLSNNCCRPRPSATSINLSSTTRTPPNYDDIYLQSPSFNNDSPPAPPPFRPTVSPPPDFPSRPPYSEYSLTYDEEENGRTNFRERYPKDDEEYTNSDNTYYRVPGPVRAHVQSVDLVPYGTRIPNPGEALERDLSHIKHR